MVFVWWWAEGLHHSSSSSHIWRADERWNNPEVSSATAEVCHGNHAFWPGAALSRSGVCLGPGGGVRGERSLAFACRSHPLFEASRKSLKCCAVDSQKEKFKKRSKRLTDKKVTFPLKTFCLFGHLLWCIFNNIYYVFFPFCSHVLTLGALAGSRRAFKKRLAKVKDQLSTSHSTQISLYSSK